VPGAAAGYKDGLLVVGLPVPKDDGLDAAAARVVGDLAARLPDVGAAARVSNWSGL
jgi:solute carrier family 25 phosphate transporter 23/24/25/41